MPKLRVIHKSLHYDGREIAVGESFVATPVDAAHLKKRGQAEDYVARAPVGEVASTTPPPAPPATVADLAAPLAPRRTLNRRISTDD